MELHDLDLSPQDESDVRRYLERIGYDGPLDPTLETLTRLHRAHLLAVPFENLDLYLGRPIVLDEKALFRKIVEERRGGFCYELNGLFAWLLRKLDFDVAYLSANVRRAEGGFGPDFDHMALLVRLQERWLADVGFGESTDVPLPIDSSESSNPATGDYRVVNVSGFRRLQRLVDGSWSDQYQFTLIPRQLEEFAGMCDFHQTSPDSHFTKGRICSVRTPGGRTSLSDKGLVITTGADRNERPLAGDHEYGALLHEYFGMELM